MNKIFSVILSIVVLVTSMGFTVSSHICGGKKVKTILSVGAADVSCGMEKKANNCADSSIMKKNCCEDEFQLIQNDEDFNQQLTQFDLSTDFVLAFVISYFELHQGETITADCFKDNSPPPLIKDIPILIQSFLI